MNGELLCFDRVVDLELQTLAASVAASENPANRRRRPFEAAGIPRKRWAPGRRLAVRFLDGPADLQRRVVAAAQRWAGSANVLFDFLVGPDDADTPIRITFEDTGAWSALGTDALLTEAYPLASPTMSLSTLVSSSSDAEITRYTLHEFGHALGLIHEHQSPGATVAWNHEVVYAALSGPPNHWDRATIDVNFFDRYERTATQFTAFDRESIMLYAFPPTWTLDGRVYPANDTLSATDHQFVAALYPRSGQGPRGLGEER